MGSESDPNQLGSLPVSSNIQVANTNQIATLQKKKKVKKNPSKSSKKSLFWGFTSKIISPTTFFLALFGLIILSGIFFYRLRFSPSSQQTSPYSPFPFDIPSPQSQPPPVRPNFFSPLTTPTPSSTSSEDNSNALKASDFSRLSSDPAAAILPDVERIPLLDEKSKSSVDLPQQTHTFKSFQTASDVSMSPNGWFLTKNVRTRRITDPVENLIPSKLNLGDYIVEVFPHDTTCFSQGYVFHRGILFESCGLYGESQLRTVNYTTGEAILTSSPIPDTTFAEGIAVIVPLPGDQDEESSSSSSSSSGHSKHKNKHKNKQKKTVEDPAELFLLTWREGVIHRFKTSNLTHQLDDLKLPTEGWGLTVDPRYQQLVVSDGSNILRWYDPKTMELVRELSVYMWRGTTFTSVRNLNELEWIGGEIWANVWYSDHIHVINPYNGQVERILTGSHLHTSRSPDEDVFNGIAYGKNATGHLTLLVTGKKWSKTFQLNHTELVLDKEEESTTFE